uniref:Uncharacterized protein n=1 Tax=Sphaerodactylus townsendi TaxID=933632 RepID=A0ACB8FIP1_9SAUR
MTTLPLARTLAQLSSSTGGHMGCKRRLPRSKRAPEVQGPGLPPPAMGPLPCPGAASRAGKGKRLRIGLAKTRGNLLQSPKGTPCLALKTRGGAGWGGGSPSTPRWGSTGQAPFDLRAEARNGPGPQAIRQGNPKGSSVNGAESPWSPAPTPTPNPAPLRSTRDSLRPGGRPKAVASGPASPGLDRHSGRVVLPAGAAGQAPGEGGPGSGGA